MIDVIHGIEHSGLADEFFSAVTETMRKYVVKLLIGNLKEKIIIFALKNMNHQTLLPTPK